MNYSIPVITLLRNTLILVVVIFLYNTKIIKIDTQYFVNLTEPYFVSGGDTTSLCENIEVGTLSVVEFNIPAEKSSPKPPKSSEKVTKKVVNNLPTPRRYYNEYEIVIWMLKSFENFSPTSFPDHSQYSIGWGTKSVKDVSISVKDADVAFLDHFNKVYNKFIIDYPNIAKDKFLSYVLANALYNVGSFGKGMTRTLKQYNHSWPEDKKRKHLQKICNYLKQYKRASGKVLEGLVKRRKAECELILADEITRQQLGEFYRIKVENILQKALYN